MNSKDPAKRVKRFRKMTRFSLRSLLTLMTIGAIGIAYVAHFIQRQTAAVEAIREHGGAVHYKLSPRYSWVPESIRNLAPRDLFHDVVAVHLNSRIDAKRRVITNILRNDTVWQHLDNLPELRILMMDYGEVSPESLRHLSNATKLRQILFNDVVLGDAAISHLKDLTQIRDIQLFGSGLTDKSVELFATFPQLQRLQLSRCDLSDRSLQAMAGCESIVTLGFIDSLGSISDQAIKSVVAMKNLKTLNLQGSELTDADLAALGKNKSIKVFHVGETNVTWHAANQLKKTSRPDVQFQGGGLAQRARPAAGLPTYEGSDKQP